MNQIEKDRFGKTESKQRHATIEEHREEIIGLMKKSRIVDPVGVMLDITGTYGRQMHMAWNVSNGMSEAEAEKKIAEAISYYEGEGRFPTLLMVWTWGEAERLMPLTSPTSSESLRGLKWTIEPGMAGVIVIGRHGNSYGIVQLSE